MNKPTNKNTAKLLLKGGRVINPDNKIDDVLDVLVIDGKIEAIGPDLFESDLNAKDAQIIQLTPEHWVTPGLVDIHVHFREPGNSEKETIATGAQAAIAGGFTTVCIMPNTNPVIDGLPSLQYVKQAASTTGITIHPVPAATKNLEGQELTPMGTLLQNGAVAFTDDGCPIENANMMRKALEYVSMFDTPIICHAEDKNLCGCGVMHEGYYSTLLGLPGIPSVAESAMVARDIQLAKMTGGHVHFAHLSSKDSVELIRQAKKDGLKITAETTPHNIALTDAALVDYNPNFKMYAPLRSEEDRIGLIEGLKDGTIDAIATDHAPHTPEEKQLTFDQAPRGVIGLETSLGATLTALYHTGIMDAVSVIERMTSSAAKCYNLADAGKLSIGGKADITVIAPNQKWTVDPDQFKSKSRNCPFNGQTLTGKAVMTIANGKILLNELTPVKTAVPV